MLSVSTVFGQDNPTASFYNFKTTPTVIRVYQSELDDKGQVKNTPKLTGITNIWSFDKHYNYYFKKDITVTVDGKKYVRFTIPSSTRYSPQSKTQLTIPDSLPNYDHPVWWKHEAENIDSQDFNSWLWVSEDDFNNLSQPYYQKFQGRWLMSGITTPFKYRFAAGTHSSTAVNGDVNLGTLVGWRMVNQTGTAGLSLGGFLGLGALSMTSANNTSATITSTNSISNFAFNYGGGVILDLDKKFQIGILGGFDHATGDLAGSYIYQDRMWLGFSLNFKFLDFGASAKDNQNTASTSKSK